MPLVRLMRNQTVAVKKAMDKLDSKATREKCSRHGKKESAETTRRDLAHEDLVSCLKMSKRQMREIVPEMAETSRVVV